MAQTASLPSTSSRVQSGWARRLSARSSGSGFLDHFVGATADDLPTNISAMRSFLRACSAKPLPVDEFETALSWNIVVPAQIRANLASREIDCDDVLSGLEVPLLVTQGRVDAVVLPAMAEHVLATCPTAEASWYDGVGHTPAWKSPSASTASWPS